MAVWNGMLAIALIITIASGTRPHVQKTSERIALTILLWSFVLVNGIFSIVALLVRRSGMRRRPTDGTT